MSEVKSTAEACYDARMALIKERDELTQQISAYQLSQQNIINAFGISCEGAHSKLVIEYVHGLVAENSALKGAIEFAEPWLPSCDGELLHIISKAKITPATDAAIAEIGAKPLDILAGVAEKMLVKFSNAGVSHCPEAVGWRLVKRQAESEAANLRAGRKG